MKCCYAGTNPHHDKDIQNILTTQHKNNGFVNKTNKKPLKLLILRIKSRSHEQPPSSERLGIIMLT